MLSRFKLGLKYSVDNIPALLIFDRYIHDEMYGVDLDLAGNYLLLGGSGDEYTYSATNADGWMSDIWVSYLVVVDPQVQDNFS